MMNEYSDFTPVDRSRAYTWHGSHSGIEDGCNTTNKFAMTVQTYSGSSSAGPSSKKPWSRRNAWGSMSYADLIGKAIESTADKRMTLSQIYDWMIQNVPYFHDKGAGSSSTGWKNSIRHNLSLHRRFKRVPNEDSGKSSWWMLNDSPDQYPPTRKRTVSVGKFEGKDALAHMAPPSAKVSHIAPELLKTASQTTGSSAASQPWLQTVQPLSSFVGGTVPVRIPELKWHQPAMETDPFFVADLNTTFANPNYTQTSCTPLAPISELLSPQQFSAYDLQAVEIPSPPSYVAIQSATGEQSAFAGHILTTLSSVTMLDASAQPALETYPEVSLAPVVVESSCSAGAAKVLQAQGPPWTPGWSMLRQMLSQSHRENALMHGVVSDTQISPPTSVAEYLQSGDNHPLQPATTTPQSFASTAITDHSFSYITSPQSVPASDILYVQMTADTDDMSEIEQPIQIPSDDTEGNTQQHSVITGYIDVAAASDANAPKTVEVDNNNESEVMEKSV